MRDIEEYPVIRIADIQLRVTSLDHILVDSGNKASAVLLISIAASGFQTFPRPEHIKLQQYEELTNAFIGSRFPSEYGFDSLTIREGILRVGMKLFDNRTNRPLRFEF